MVICWWIKCNFPKSHIFTNSIFSFFFYCWRNPLADKIVTYPLSGQKQIYNVDIFKGVVLNFLISFNSRQARLLDVLTKTSRTTNLILFLYCVIIGSASNKGTQFRAIDVKMKIKLLIKHYFFGCIFSID